jgi:hypothetical protein
VRGWRRGRGRRPREQTAVEKRREDSVRRAFAAGEQRGRETGAVLEADGRRRGCGAAGVAAQRKLRGWEEEYEQEGDMMEEMVMMGAAVEGRYDSEDGDEDEQESGRGWESVGSDSNELVEEYEGYGGGAGGSDEDGLVEEWSDSGSVYRSLSDSGSEDASESGRRSDSGSEAYHSCSDCGSDASSGSVGVGGAASAEQLQGLQEAREENMRIVECEWEVVVSEGGDWDALEEKSLGPGSFEVHAMLFLQRECKEMRVECDEGSWRGSRELQARAEQWFGLLGEVRERMSGYEQRRRSAARRERRAWEMEVRVREESERLSEGLAEEGRRVREREEGGREERERQRMEQEQERVEEERRASELQEQEQARREEEVRQEELKEEERRACEDAEEERRASELWEQEQAWREEEERQRREQEQEQEREERKAHEEEMRGSPRMLAWLHRNELGHEGEWESLMRGEREASVARGELEREERKRRVSDYERRHQERIRQVPDWQRRSWEKMERWLEMSRWEEGQEEVRQMREEVKELRVVRRVLELGLAEAEAAGRCVESVSVGVQCGWGSVGWERQTRGRGARRARSERRRWERQKRGKVWMCDGGWWEERKWEWGESGKLGGAGGLRRGLLFNGQGGYITCDVPIGEMEVLG